jgi:hypothetical protein
MNGPKTMPRWKSAMPTTMMILDQSREGETVRNGRDAKGREEKDEK